jgi:transcriptional antiterminator RfaH
MVWSVAMTNPNCERIAVDNLLRQDFETYLPKFLCGPSKKETILFPGYLFVFIKKGWHAIFQTRGICHLLMSGEHPAEIKEVVVQEIKDKEGSDGFVVLPENVVGQLRYRKGQVVSVKRGPLIGMNGIVASMAGGERVRVLFKMMGRSTPVIMRADELSVA